MARYEVKRDGFGAYFAWDSKINGRHGAFTDDKAVAQATCDKLNENEARYLAIQAEHRKPERPAKPAAVAPKAETPQLDMGL